MTGARHEWLALKAEGGRLLALGRHAEALGCFDAALAAAPYEVGTAFAETGCLVGRGMCLVALGRWAEALAALDGALAFFRALDPAWGGVPMRIGGHETPTGPRTVAETEAAAREQRAIAAAGLARRRED